MPPDRFLVDASPGETPTHEDVQALIEAESGKGVQGIYRRWQASDSNRVVLVSDATGVKISRDNGATAPTHVVNDGTTAGGSLSGSYPNPGFDAAAIDALLPPGTIWAYAGVGVPAGWLRCDGAAVSRTTYAKLFAVTGANFGPGNGSTTFNVPNLSGRVALGVGGGHGLATVGGDGAGASHTHPGNHAHGMNGHTHGPGVHTHPQGAHTHDAGNHQHDINGHVHGLTDHTHGMNGHAHDLNHDHAVQLSALPVTGQLVPVTAGTLSVSVDTHRHNVDLPALGATNSGTSSTPDTAGMSAGANTGTSSAALTGPPLANTGGVTAGAATVGTPSANDTAGATGNTADANPSLPASGYAADANLPPFLTVSYIIRTGV